MIILVMLKLTKNRELYKSSRLLIKIPVFYLNIFPNNSIISFQDAESAAAHDGGLVLQS